MNEIWNTFSIAKVSDKPKNNREKIINNNKYLKNYDKSYEDIRNHVLETQEFKHENVDQKIGMLSKKKVNINV